jgi:tRNA A-37 threonylcarbamoyl transferase component Bud32
VKRDHTPHIQVPPPADGEGSAPDSGIARTVRLETPDREEAAVPAVADDLYRQYAVQGKIGDGGMGVVYLARDRRLGRFVAIKRLNREAQAVASLRHRFLHEARAVAALNHIHIVHIYALGEDADGPFIVMEYVPGPGSRTAGPRSPGPDRDRPSPPLSLDQQVSRNGQLAVNDAIDLLVKVAKAIAYAHANGVIHRDLKPSNILLDGAGEPKVVDFGLARRLHAEESKLTVPGEKLLSLGYGAPEQEQDASVSDERADVYGLGALLYFAITGQNPRYFREQDIPVPLRDVLVKALATDREQRWPTAEAFTEALQSVQTRTRVEAPTVKTTWRCKWCDTVNPLSIHFCAECGWDGSENCAECGAETFAGVQYCGGCGADARAYENVRGLLRRAQACLAAHQYERAVTFAGRVHGFEPAGPTGRQLLKESQDLRARAERALARRDQIRGQIPQEMHAENFERARDFIREFRGLSGESQAFDEEFRQLPSLTLRRDLQRARRAIRSQEWFRAEQLCQALLREVAADDPECLALLRRIRRHRWTVLGLRLGLAVFGTAVLYVLSAAPLADGWRGPPPATVRRLYGPASWVYAASGLAAPLSGYARWWGVTNLAVRLAGPERVSPRPAPARSPEWQPLERAFAQQMAELDGERRRFAEAWPAEYLRELDALMERRRKTGDFEGWADVQEERRQFEATRSIGEAPPAGEVGELAALRGKYRQLRAASRLEQCRRLQTACKKYINDLTDLQRACTKQGRMDVAAQVNQEIRRVRSSPELQEAEAVLADAAPHGEGEAGDVRALSPGDLTAELSAVRDAYREQLAAVEGDYARSLEKWPDKYISAQKQLMEQCQAAGDYSGWESARYELERFEVDRAIEPKDQVAEPRRLADVQRQYADMLAQYRVTRARGIANLADRHLRTLTEQQSKYTKAGSMDAAGQVNAEIRRIRMSPELLAAQAELAPPPAATNAPPPAVHTGAPRAP